MPLSESTALLENAVRELYQKIEPGQEPSPNELIAYADLRALRLYTGALEVAGWDFENAASNFSQADYETYRYNSNIGDDRIRQARDRYMAFRETVRTLLFRVRMTAVSAEHQISFCDSRAVREWQSNVYPALIDTIRSTQPLFYDDASDSMRYHAPGTTASNIIQTSSGVPSNAVEIRDRGTFKPFDGKGQGTGRYFEVKAFQGPIRLKQIRFIEIDRTFNTIDSRAERVISLNNRVVEANSAAYIACNRDRMVDVTRIEIEWEPADGSRRTYGSIDLVGDIPQQRR